MTLNCSIENGRYTSKDVLIQFLPCGEVQEHIQHLRFHADVTAGTFKLRVNGHLTAAITYSATEATLITSVNAALDALPNLDAAELVLSGASTADMTLTSTPDAFYEILVEDDLLTGNATADPNVTTDVTQQGAALLTLSAQISSFSFEETTETVEVTSISEYEATEIPVKSTMTFDMSLFDADEDWTYAVRAGYRGILTVYPKGKTPGNRYFSFWALFDSVSTDYPDHEVVEKEISGQRQGAMVVPFGAIYA